MTGNPKIGVFGGSFDPPHAAHLTLARSALQHLALDRLLILPTGQAWHKQRILSPAHHRLAMAKLAFGDLARVAIDAREIDRPGPSYTIDTLREIAADWPGADLFLLIGEDQARAWQHWHEGAKIPGLATICIAARLTSSGADGDFQVPQAWKQRFLRLPMAPMALSATELRARLGAHQNVSPLVPEPVARYIEDHHLYQAT
ncbi:putative nicotinate-nucleotide adenylyltransferase [Comamonadaceae bacterium]|nr:putative nicotinate-nucleotide adenylyltransferase [Comamonadaceae bacterium]